MSVDDVIYNYNDLINPCNLFKTEKEFNEFVNIPATKEELISFLRICEVNNLINNLISALY